MLISAIHFCNNKLLFQTGDFHSIGMLVGMAITQGGSGSPFFAPSMYHYICGRDVRSISPSLQEVPDHDLYAVLVKVCLTTGSNWFFNWIMLVNFVL